MTRTFLFPSALVLRAEMNSIKVRFFARTKDRLLLTIDENVESFAFGDNAAIKLKVAAGRGLQICPDLPTEDEDYTPGIEFHFTGAYTASVLADGTDRFQVVSNGDITCLEVSGLPCSAEELNKASIIAIGGERGAYSPHFPK
jgi:hypothetical protein